MKHIDLFAAPQTGGGGGGGVVGVVLSHSLPVPTRPASWDLSCLLGGVHWCLWTQSLLFVGIYVVLSRARLIQDPDGVSGSWADLSTYHTHLG